MARLTAQQKRDREYMALTGVELAAQRQEFDAEVEIRVAKAWSNGYDHGKREGHTLALRQFRVMSRWRRFWW